MKLYDKFGDQLQLNYTRYRYPDVLSELFASGARDQPGRPANNCHIGSALQRFPDRVNDKLITVNPVVIQAVGNPDLLASGLDIIKNNMEASRGIRFEIVRVELLTLPAYTQVGD